MLASNRSVTVRGMNLPTGTVTFLLTDVEGWTSLWERDPDGMRRALACHDEIVQVSVAAHGGFVFTTIP